MYIWDFILGTLKTFYFVFLSHLYELGRIEADTQVEADEISMIK